MPSGSTGFLENRDPDHALITASLAAHRAARCRAADELLSAASRRSPGVNVSAKTVPGWSTCSAKSGIETRSMPTPKMPMGTNLVDRIPVLRKGSRSAVPAVLAEARLRIEQHVSLLTLLRRIVVEAPVGGPLVQRTTAGDGRCQPVLTGQYALARPPQVVLPLGRIECGHQRLRVHQRDHARHVTEPE